MFGIHIFLLLRKMFNCFNIFLSFFRIENQTGIEAFNNGYYNLSKYHALHIQNTYIFF